MNKKVKKIIASTLVISGLSAVEPVKYISLMTTKAEADSTKVNLKSIGLSDGEINFSQDIKKYTVKVSTNIDQITIKAKPDAKSSDYDDYTLEIDGQIVTEDDGFKTTVDLAKGNNYIEINISNKDGKEKNYKLTIIRGVADGEEQQYGDDVYLDDIYLDYGYIDIDFDKDVTSYNINVPEDMKEIMVRVDPEDKDGKVQINGITVKEDKGDDRTKDFRKTVNLKPGNNEIEIQVTDEEEENIKVYTLNLNRGGNDNSTPTKTSTNTATTADTKGTSNITTGTTVTTENSQNVKANQWIHLANGWAYNDDLGNQLKNTWFFDKAIGSTYYLKADGIMATGWLNYNYNWYYLNESGVRESGWKYLNNNWYYLDYDGVMQKGWFKDIDGKWYYLKDTGEMAENVTIDGYTLGVNGALIK